MNSLIIENQSIPRTIFGVMHTKKDENKITFNICRIFPTEAQALAEYNGLMQYPTLYLNVKKLKWSMNTSDWDNDMIEKCNCVIYPYPH